MKRFNYFGSTHVKKRLWGVLLLVLLSSIAIVGVMCQVAVTASGTIYIRADGSVAPEIAPIQRVGDTYTFTENIYSPFVLDMSALVVERDNIVIDGAGHSLQGIGNGMGINITSRSNMTIQNLEIKKFGVGIIIWESSNNTIFNNTITQNDVGIGMWQVSDTKISGNVIIANSGSGIAIAGNGTLNRIVGNYIANNRVGIGFGYGSFNTVAENYIANNEEGIYFGGNPPAQSASNNTIYRNSFINNTKQVNDNHWASSFSQPSINRWDNGVKGNYWSDYRGKYPNSTELDSSGIWSTPYVIDADNKDNYPLVSNPLPPPPDNTPPAIVIISPENKSYPLNNVSLTFAVNETVFRMAYSLDGQASVTVAANTTLIGLREGEHNIVIHASDSFGNTGASNVTFFSIDMSPPIVSILSPENKTYDTTDVPLTFTINEPTSLMAYSLDGQANVTIAANATLAVLSQGSHSVVVYANDTAGNVGASKIVYFNIQPFPIMLVATATVVIVIIVAALVVYRKVKK